MAETVPLESEELAPLAATDEASEEEAHQSADIKPKENGTATRGDGFEDSFVIEATPKKSTTPPPAAEPEKTQRFSDDFSNVEQLADKAPSSSTPAHVTHQEEEDRPEEQPKEPDEKKAEPSSDDPLVTNAAVQPNDAKVEVIHEPMVPKPQKQPWEKFEDEVAASKAKRRLSFDKEDDKEGDKSSNPLCVVDSTTNETQWTALNTSQLQPFDKYSSPSDGLPFRRTQSMRADTHRAIRLVDSLKQQRRLSNTSLDREPILFTNEDELTRKYKLEREWQVLMKMRKRIPGTKTHWLPVRVSVKLGVLFVKKGAALEGDIGETMPPMQEITLQHHNTVTAPVPRRFERRRSKVHQIKLQQTQVREKRTLKRFLFVEHVSQTHTLIKLGSRDLNVIQNVSDAINEAVRQLPVTRAPGVAYKMNEVFIDVKEQSEILMNCDGAVLDRKSLNRIYVQAFLTGSPDCQLTLNDVEYMLLQGKSQLSQALTRHVRLCDIVIHPCVNKDSYRTTREICFQPVDGYTFELLRCSIDPHVSPPLTLSCLMEYNPSQHTVKLTSSFIVRKKHNLHLRPITNLAIKFPIPPSWASLFLTEKFGQSITVGSRSSLRGSFRRKIRNRECQIETQLGSAKYEPEHSAVMWRIGTYQRTSVPHELSCEISLKAGMQKPDTQNEFAEVTYTVPGSSTGLAVRGFKTDGTSPETWVKYEIQYRYKVQLFPDLSID